MGKVSHRSVSMKNTFKLFGIITVAAVIAFTMAACNGGTTSSKNGNGNGNSGGAGSKTITVNSIDTEYEGRFFGFGITAGGNFGTPLAGGEGHISGGKASSVIKKLDGSALDNGTYYIWINIYRSNSRTDMQGVKYFRTKNSTEIKSDISSLDFSDFEFNFETPVLPQ